MLLPLLLNNSIFTPVEGSCATSSLLLFSARVSEQALGSVDIKSSSLGSSTQLAAARLGSASASEQALRLSATFKNSTGAVADPTTATVLVRSPSGVNTTKTYPTDAEVVRTSTGVYYFDVTMGESGTWTYRFEGTGSVQAASADKPVQIASSVFES